MEIKTQAGTRVITISRKLVPFINTVPPGILVLSQKIILTNDSNDVLFFIHSFMLIELLACG